ncbi:MAG: DNA translocase FtsK 4TM domain-containing protein [Anaerolineales bacterium]|nr:DNA translocase FtsK 4TM domain-containing protein [Anaerolineales bacterium]
MASRLSIALPSGVWPLSRERKLDVLGVVLALTGGLTLWLMLSGPTGLGRSWILLLRSLVGWGLIVVPIGLIAIGLWLVLRHFGERLPRLTIGQIVGVGLLYLALLAVLHAVLGADDWAQTVEMARQGQGGGMIGGTIAYLLLSGLGAAGGAVVLLAVGVWAAGLISRTSLVAWVSRLPQPVPARPVAAAPTVAAPRRPMEGTPPGPGAAPSRPAVPPRPQPALEIAPEVVPSQPAWSLPEIAEILEPGVEGKADDAFDRQRAKMIEETLMAFGAPAHVVETNRGPTITQFGVEPDFLDGRGGRRTKVKISKISALADDLALALAATSIRVEAPVPGKGFVGIEVPNPEVSLVALRDLLESPQARKVTSKLRIALGRDVSGQPIAADLASMPHLLIAGTTGSGKSVCVNAIIACLLMQATPDELKFVMVDPKRVELTFYNGVPHLLAPVVVDLERVVPALQWVAREMDERYRKFARDGARNIMEFNAKAAAAGQKAMPFLVVVIDELADLMMMAPDETERVVTRLAQLARATGIHLVIATQRPSVDVVTGLIKANFPSRIAFAVASSVDSRVILDQPGAERLLGRGDMLFQAPDAAAPVRMQGAYVSEIELNRLILFWRAAARTGESPSAGTALPVGMALPSGVPLKQAPLWEEMEGGKGAEAGDPLYPEAVAIVRGMRRASISLLQRRMRIGYTRSARLIDQLEANAIIGPAKEGSQAREVLDYGPLPMGEGPE